MDSTFALNLTLAVSASKAFEMDKTNEGRAMPLDGDTVRFCDGGPTDLRLMSAS